jgi:hypothetical protein
LPVTTVFTISAAAISSSTTRKMRRPMTRQR